MEQPIAQPSLALALEPRLGRYRLHHELASGGMASVYLASVESEEGFSKIVALKRIHEHLAKDPEFVEMFLDEARIAARIEHPNVCTVFDFGQVAESYFIAMEYLMGETVRALMREQGRRPRSDAWPAMAAHLIGQACEGLHAAHELRGTDGSPVGLVHRDVSPQNLFVTYGGCLKVVDFGIARAEGKSHHTAPGTIKGKFSYIAPEQLTAGPDVDRRADVWSLGVTLWEMLALRPLFRRENAVETLTAVVNGPIPKPSAIRPEVPSALDAIALRALSRKRDERYATAREMGRELAAFLREQHAVSVVDIEEHMERLFAEEKTKKLAMTQWVRESSVIRKRRVVANDREPLDDDTPVARVARTDAARVRTRRSRWPAVGLVATLAIVGVAAVVVDAFPPERASVDASTERHVAERGELATARSGSPPTSPTPSAITSIAASMERGATLAASDATTAPRAVARGRGRARAMRPTRPAIVSTNELDLPPLPSGSTASAAAAEPPIEASAATTSANDPSAAAASSAPTVASEPIPTASSTPSAARPTGARRSPPPAEPRLAPALDATVSLRNLEARGSLPASAVSRALARHLGHLRSCYAGAARRAGRDAAGDVDVRFVIDEMGAARGVSAGGGPLPGVAACVGTALNGLRTGSRPDIGRVDVRVEVRFSPLGIRSPR